MTSYIYEGAPGAWTAETFWRLDVHADAQLVMPDAGGATAPVFLHRDHLASAKLTTDATGCVASRSAYRIIVVLKKNQELIGRMELMRIRMIITTIANQIRNDANISTSVRI